MDIKFCLDGPVDVLHVSGPLFDFGKLKACFERHTRAKDTLPVPTPTEEDLEKDQAHVLSFQEIKRATELIDNGVIHTPLCEAKLSKCVEYEIYLKCENLQYTGSCVERGVRNAMLMDIDKVRHRGVIVPSNGNLALAASYQGGLLGVPVTVVLPERTPPALAQHCADHHADVVIFGNNVDESIAYAKKVKKESRQILISTDEPAVMAGMGTVGIEIITQLPEVDAIIVPCASGGLLASIITACKKLKCSCLIYGVECFKAPTVMKALHAGKPIPITPAPCIADGLNRAIAGTNAFATIKGRVDRMLLVDEAWIARAMINMLERERLVVDGAGVCAVAALMQGLVPELRGRRTVCVVSSGNIDSGRLARVIQRGLSASGRLLRFAVAVPDQRSGLEQLSKAISEEGAVLKSFVTEQMWIHSDISTTWARRDGITLLPWKNGRALLWDATCVDTLAPCHLSGSAGQTAYAAAKAESLKQLKYSVFKNDFYFVPFAVETLGPWGKEARLFFKEISARLVEVCGDPRAGSYLGQRISLVIQRGNAASILGTLPYSESDEFHEIYRL